MDMMELRRQIALNEPHLVTTTPSGIATFSTDMIAPLKGCKVEFSPVQSGSGDPSPSNVRPISGWTECNVWKTGANIWDEQWVVGAIISDGSIDVSATNRRTTLYIPVVGGKTYYQKCPSSAGGGRVAYYNGLKEKVSVDTANGIAANTTFTVPDDACYMRVTFRVQYGTTYNNDISINYPSTDTSYHAYVGSTLPLTWSSAGTVYGGYVDLVRGELVAEWVSITATWGEWGTVSDQGDGTELRYKRFPYPIIGNSAGADVSFCNVAKYRYGNQDGTIHFYNVTNSYNCRIYLPTGTDTNIQIQAVGKLVAPITYPLTPTVLKTLRGANNIWSNTNNNITVSYWKH